MGETIDQNLMKDPWLLAKVLNVIVYLILKKLVDELSHFVQSSELYGFLFSLDKDFSG